jgi:hypothetical protein
LTMPCGGGGADEILNIKPTPSNNFKYVLEKNFPIPDLTRIGV